VSSGGSLTLFFYSQYFNAEEELVIPQDESFEARRKFKEEIGGESDNQRQERHIESLKT